MEQNKRNRIIISFLGFLAFVALFSLLSVRLWGGKPEKIPVPQELKFQEEMTVMEFGQANGLPNQLLKEVFGLVSKEDLQKKVKEFGISQQEMFSKVKKASALEAEHESKDWLKIGIKFLVWIIFLGFVFSLMRKGKISSKLRKRLLLSGVIIFGIILGSDPSPMGTIKDAIAMLGKSGVIFPPRMIALGIFLLMVFVANKFICTWGCQFGTFQDFIFRLNRDPKDAKGVMKQYKPSFAFSNAVRVVFLALFTLIAFAWATDIVEFFDPFKTFVPSKLGVAGIVFVGALSIASLFVYRPWCHFFCPFGLAGWIVEKISLYKINVNYETCIACEACNKACPSTVMGAILKQERVIPDCFSCGTCIGTCPTDSISFQSGRRNKPPEGKFKKA